MKIETKYDIGQLVYFRRFRKNTVEIEGMITAIWYDGKSTRYEVVFDKGRITIPESSIVNP